MIVANARSSYSLPFISTSPSPLPASSSSPCATMGTANLFNMSVDICEEFHAGAVAISLPQDTDFVKYGDISCPRLGSSKLCHFNDRFSWIVDPGPSTNVTLYPFSSDLVRYILDNTPDNASTSMMVFKAEFNKTSDEREIVALTLVLFIDPRAMMRPFMGLSFIGTLINKNQGPDVGSSYWFRWDLSDRFVLEDSMWLLEGFFTNLYNGVYETNQTGGLCPKDFDTCNDVCRPTLISWVNEETWFNEAVGYGSIKFYWNSGVRAPLDSQFVPVFQAKDNWIKEYMAPLPTPSMLLSSNVQVDDSYSFLNMAISDYSQLQYFNGNFSRQKPYKTCGHYLPGSGVVP